MISMFHVLFLGIFLLVPIGGVMFVMAVVRTLSRAARRDSAGRADEQRALTQLLDDIERMEKRVAVLETLLSEEPAPVRSGSGAEV
jgi:phage shock protein B